jgi:hypothetical protein
MTATSEGRTENGVFDASIIPIRHATDLQLDDDGQLAMYDPQGARLVVLNESAAAFWAQCDGARDLGAIVQHLGGMFSVDHRDLVADVWATYLHLVELGLVEEARHAVSD